MSFPYDIQHPSINTNNFNGLNIKDNNDDKTKKISQDDKSTNIIENSNNKPEKDTVDKPKKKKKKISKKRCNMEGCKKKLGLCALECKCKMKFCSSHFSSSSHKCTYDYQKAYRDRLEKSRGEKITFSKIDKL